DRVRRLVAGESIEIANAAAGPASRAASAGHEPAPETASTSADPPPRGPSAALPQAPAWRDLARQGNYKKAYGRSGSGRRTGEAHGKIVEDLLALADVARLSGHPAEAVTPLSLIVERHAGDARAASAAFTLGRVELDALGNASAAEGAFARALALGLSSSLVEDARARIVEARARAGNRAGAKAAADDYERRYPAG